MHKSVTTLTLFLMGTLIMLVPFTSINFSNVKAQEYGSYDDDDRYSKYPTEVNKYECRTGPLEGFFVSSVEFCKFKFDDKDRKDHSRDNNQTGTQGPPGPVGPQGPQGDTGATGATGPQGIRGERGLTGVTGMEGPPGADGQDGLNGQNGAAGMQGPSGITSLNSTNTYEVVRNSDFLVGTLPGTWFTFANPRCDPEDIVLSGGFTLTNFNTANTVTITDNRVGNTTWEILLRSATNWEPFQATILCFDNPPLTP